MLNARSAPSPLLVALAGGLFVAVVVACGTPSGAAAGPTSRGEKFFLMKCNACHPNGGQGAGPPIDVAMAPSFLERGKTSGRHGVPEPEFDALIAYMNQRFGGAAVTTAVAAAPVTTTPATTTVATTTVATTTPVAVSGDIARGERYFQAKCNRCHPGGGRGVGPATIGAPLPGPLKSTTTGGRHDVPPDEYDSMIAYLVSKNGGAPAAAVAATPVATPATPVTTTVAAVAPSSGDPAQGAAYYQAKCNKCHPGGNKGVGPAIAGKTIPGILVSGGSGKHGVEPASFENLLAYMTTLGAVRAGGPTATAPAATPLGTTTTTTAPPPPPPPPNGTIPANAGMVPCSCSCQCPPGTPPAALPAACICQCSCPR